MNHSDASHCPLLTGADFPPTLIEPLVARLNPPLLAEFELEPFVRLVLGSYSLSMVDKWRVFQAIPTLSEFQHSELCQVFADEIQEFIALIANEGRAVMHLTAKTWIQASVLANYYGVGFSSQEKEFAALRPLLAHKYNTAMRRAWIEDVPMAEWTPLMRYVFGFLVKPEDSQPELVAI